MASGSNIQDLLRELDVHAMKGMLLESGASGSLHMTFSDEVIRKAVYQPLPATFSIAGEPHSTHRIFTGRHLWSDASRAAPHRHYK